MTIFFYFVLYSHDFEERDGIVFHKCLQLMSPSHPLTHTHAHTLTFLPMPQGKNTPESKEEERSTGFVNRCFTVGFIVGLFALFFL